MLYAITSKPFPEQSMQCDLHNVLGKPHSLRETGLFLGEAESAELT